MTHAQRAAGAPEWGTTYAYEMRTLIPAVSYVADLRAMAVEIARDLASALRNGGIPEPLLEVPLGVADLATQAMAVEEHLRERVDIIRASARQSAVDIEVLSRLYDSEVRVAGGRSRVGAAVDAAVLAGESRKLIAKSATARADAAQGAAHLMPRGDFRSRATASQRTAPAPPSRPPTRCCSLSSRPTCCSLRTSTSCARATALTTTPSGAARQVRRSPCVRRVLWCASTRSRGRIHCRLWQEAAEAFENMMLEEEEEEEELQCQYTTTASATPWPGRPHQTGTHCRWGPCSWP